MAITRINKGSDLSLVCTLLDETGTAQDITGYTVAIYDEPDWATPFLSAAVTSAATGVVTVTMTWDDAAFDNSDRKRLEFRLKWTVGGVNETSEILTVEWR